MSYINEQAADNAGKMVARRLFSGRQISSATGTITMNEEEVALLCKAAFELGVQATIKTAVEDALKDELDIRG